MSKNWLILPIILAAIVGGFWITHRKPIKTESAEGFLFHPDAVKDLTWQLGDKSFKFHREDRRQEWTPAVNPVRVQRKLIALGTAAVQKMSPSSSGIKITIGFGGENVWVGIYKGGEFVWTDGLKKSQGFKADDHFRAIFEEGKWAFNELRYDWCAGRPKILSFELADKKMKLQNQNGKWQVTDNGDKKSSAILDTTFVETWFSKNCGIQTTGYVDTDEYSVPGSSTGDSFDVEFDDGKKISWEKVGNAWVVSKDMAIVSDSFTAALQELLTYPRTK